MQKIIERIQNLLSLATSDNEHEAQLAATRAQELMLKHNLEAKDVKGQAENVIKEMVMAVEPYLRIHQKFILPILGRHFQVGIIIRSQFVENTVDGRRKFKKAIVMVGNSINIEIANHVFSFLSQQFQGLWLSYKRANGLDETSRQSYYHGLAQGFEGQLTATKEKVEQETGLVVVEDAAVREYMSRKNLSHRRRSARISDQRAISDGMEQGRKLQHRKSLK